MTRSRGSISIPLVCLAILGCSSAGAGDSRSLTISESGNGKGVVVTMSDALARSLVEGVVGSDLECGAELDEDFAAILLELDREGRGSRITVRNEDGVIRAKRTGRSLKMDIRDGAGGGGLEIKMPWAVAECMLDGSVTLKAKDMGSIKVKVVGDSGGSFEFTVK
jgi:hypothetical protein